MPGSKRSKLKKMLSPGSTPQGSIHSVVSENSVTSPPPLNGAIPPPAIPAGAQGIATDGDNYLPDATLEDELRIVDEMQRREQTVGTGMDLGQRDAVVSPTSPAPSGMSSGGKKKTSRQRFEEREARKQAAMLAANPEGDGAQGELFEREKREEADVIGGACAVLGKAIYEIAPDGHCMYSAIADQLALIGIIPQEQASNPLYTRQAAAEYMRAHPDDFMPFLPSVAGEDATDASEDGMMTKSGFKMYCERVVSSGDWGGEPEIQALSRTFEVPIHVIQRGPPTIVSHGGGATTDGAMTPEQSKAVGDRVVRISYHRRMYGLGEHYNSLRPVA